MALERCRREVVKPGPAGFRRLRHVLSHCREAILNYSDHRVTNDFAEGKNGRIKVVIRQGCCYRNLDNLALCILACRLPVESR